MKISVFGSGYVGLVQAAVLAELGHQVLCVDIDQARIKRLMCADIPIYEPGLDKLIAHNLNTERLHFSDDSALGVTHAEVIFIAVGTPTGDDGAADLSQVMSVAHNIGQHMQTRTIVVDKSTVPVGTADQVHECISQALRARACSLPVDVVSNPEFLKEGAAVADCMRPERIIIGTHSSYAIEVLSELYAPLNRNHNKIQIMDTRSAELTKYAANVMLATKISLMNELACYAEKVGADIEQVRLGIGSDSRIGYHFIYAGCGYGGSCFPKDVRALITSTTQVGCDAGILRAVESRNSQQKKRIFEKLQDYFDGDLTGRTLALWGLAFKPNTDDLREAPSLTLMQALWDAGAKVQAYDPIAMPACQLLFGPRDDLHLAPSKEAALIGADGLIILTEYQAFRAPDFSLIKQRLKSPVIFDGRNLFKPKSLQQQGFTYFSIGRRTKYQSATAAIDTPKFRQT